MKSVDVPSLYQASSQVLAAALETGPSYSDLSFRPVFSANETSRAENLRS
jgi:hypothetical protein